MPSIDLPRLLGERGPSEARNRRAIREKLLARRSLASTDHKEICNWVDNALSEAKTLRDELWDNPKDEQKRRLCLALITEAVYLASDSEGRLVLWLRKKCVDLTGITKATPLLRLTLKAYGPYKYDGDAQQRRQSDKDVSRDYKAIVRLLSPDILPCDLVNVWSQPGFGIDASSRPGSGVPHRDPTQSKHVRVNATTPTYVRLANRPDGEILLLVDKRSKTYRLLGTVGDPNTVSQVKNLVRQRRLGIRRSTVPGE